MPIHRRMDDGMLGERHLVGFVEYLKDTVRRGGSLLYRADDAAQHAHRLHQQADVSQEGDQPARGELAADHVAPADPEDDCERHDEDDLDDALQRAAHLRALHQRLEVEVALLPETLILLLLRGERANDLYRRYRLLGDGGHHREALLDHSADFAQL